MRVVPYEKALEARWNAFVDGSKNGTFLLRRDYLEYHADRFADHSLVVTDDDGGWLAALPANRKERQLQSHGGLTYGGFVVDARMTTPLMLEVFAAVAAHLRGQGLDSVLYKCVPPIYHRVPAEEDRYALFRAGARLVRRDVLSVVDARQRLPLQERRRRGVKRAQKAGVEVRPSDDLASYWRLLEGNLGDRHQARPVHTLEEIGLLRSRFPERIRLTGAFLGGELLAGVVVYESETVAHAQYIGSTPAGREHGALDLLFDRLIHEVYAHKRYFDFGISNEDQGRVLNVGLIEQKEGFGARAVVHDFYDWGLTS